MNKEFLKKKLNKKYPNKKQQLLEESLIFLGVTVSADIISSLMKDAFNASRDAQTTAITDSGLTSEKDWVCYGDNPCDFCLGMQANNPYPVNYQENSHPNCLCGWEPHFE
jgi:hypothetical protein